MLIKMNTIEDVVAVDNIEKSSYKQGIALEPFLHQVAGRATMMCLDETTVCKPLNFREHFFYKSLPPDILQFTPKFKGVVKVNIEETPDGCVALTAYPDELQSSGELSHYYDDHLLSDSSEEEQEYFSPGTATTISSQTNNYFPPSNRIKLRRTGSMYIEDQSISCKSADGLKLPKALPANPWIYKVHKEGLKRHLQHKHRVVQKCILLENVASQFQKPCILDLKMGTRLHGDYDDEQKKMRHEEKCKQTTTQPLGVRLSGMQVYYSNTDTYVCHDKYYGRKLDKSGLVGALQQFFHDGFRTRYELLIPVLNRLKSILDSLRRLGSYRFYSSSLLVMYDGADISNLDYQSDSTSSKNCEDGTCTCCESQNAFESNSSVNSERDSKTTTCSHTLNNMGDQKTSNENSVHFDIRMIDFAKSTHQDMDKSMIHDGPDHGYIFGLTNLIKILKEILKLEALSNV